ncbi:MAG: hypothetical protein AAB507_01305 [Patescibacteria group bacterium]
MTNGNNQSKLGGPPYPPPDDKVPKAGASQEESSPSINRIEEMPESVALEKIAEIESDIDTIKTRESLGYLRLVSISKHPSEKVKQRAQNVLQGLESLPTSPQTEKVPKNQTTKTVQLSTEEMAAAQTRFDENIRKETEAKKDEALKEIAGSEREILSLDLGESRMALTSFKSRAKYFSQPGQPEEVKQAAKSALAKMEQRVNELSRQEQAPTGKDVEIEVSDTPLDIGLGTETPLDFDLSEPASTEIPPAGASSEVAPELDKNAPVISRKELEERGLIKSNRRGKQVPGDVSTPGDDELLNLFKKRKSIGDLFETPATEETKADSGLTLGKETWDKKMEGLRPRGALEKRGEALEKEASLLEKTGKIGRGMLEKWRGVGEWYNKQPTKIKLAVSLGLTAAALGSGALAIGAGAAIFGGLAGTARLIGSAGTFVFIEKILHTAHAQKTGKERDTGWTEKRQVAEAFIFSVLLGGGFASLAGHNIASGRLMEALGFGGGKTSIVTEMVREAPRPITKPSGTYVTPEQMPAGATLPEYTAVKDDNLYKIIRGNFSDIKNLPAGQQENAIENILAQIRKDPESFGIKGDNINALKAGDIINIQKISEIIESHQIGGQSIVEHAEGLSPETVEHIKGWVSPDKPSLGSFDGGVHTVDLATFNEAGQETVTDAPVEKGGEDVVLSEPKVFPETPREIKSVVSGEILVKHFDTPSEKLEGVLSRHDMIIVEDARQMLRIKLDDAFGSKGFFGFGAVPGEKSAEWFALKGKTIGELVLDKSPNEASIKVQNFVGGLAGESGQMARKSESVQDFVKRAMLIITKAGNEKIT